MARPRFSTATVLAVVLWLICGVYATQFVYRGWIPHDEGTIGQTAERVLLGELPHRDFDETYTSGLTYLHAGGMKVLGVNLRTPRLIVFAFFMAFLAAVHGIGRRISSPGGALVAMALAAVWSVPNYFVSLPSWYNLFFATFGVLAFLHFLETDRRRWLVVAGVCGGFSLLAKISGVTYLAGGLLFLAYVEQTRAPRVPRDGLLDAAPRMLLATVAALCLAAIANLVASGTIEPDLLQLFVPGMVVGLFFAWREWTSGPGGARQRARCLWSLYWPFIAGAVLPVIALVLVYWQQDAVMDLVRGTVILPQRRLGEASWNPPSIIRWGVAAPYALLLIADDRRPVRSGALPALAFAVPLAVAFLLGDRPVMNSVIFAVARSMTMVAVVAGVWVLGTRRARAGSEMTVSRQPHVFLLITMAAMVSLVQFPYATKTYFFYAAPMTLLAVVAVIFSRPQAPARLHLSVAAFFFLFAVAFTNQSYVGDRDVTPGFAPYRVNSLLDLERGGLLVPPKDKQTYEAVVRLLKAHAAGGTIYAGPDCPEIYFLSGFPNPTPAIFDFLTMGREDASWMESLLARAPIRAVVINTSARFSAPLDLEVVALLERRFPSSERVGRFVVRFQ